MSNFAQFMKKNKAARENVSYAATKSLLDENGQPLCWELRPISSQENAQLREDCMEEVPVAGKPNMFRQRLNTSQYIVELLAASCVVPNLYDKELQDSYGVMNPKDLLFALIDNPGEYDAFTGFVQKLNGFDVSFQEKVDEAKN